MDPIQDPITNWQSIQKDTGLRQRRTGKSGMTFFKSFDTVSCCLSNSNDYRRPIIPPYCFFYLQ